MGKIFYIFGKSASGKDTLYKELISDDGLNLKPVTLYTTRPIREGELHGISYYFVDETKLAEMQKAGKVIEHRVYNTVFGPWHYFMADDGNIDLDNSNYLIIGTLESYCSVRDYFGDERVVPLYIYVEDGVRLMRSIERESKESCPSYEEVCRRFLADSKDFSDENLAKAQINKYFNNENFDFCLKELKSEILNKD